MEKLLFIRVIVNSFVNFFVKQRDIVIFMINHIKTIIKFAGNKLNNTR